MQKFTLSIVLILFLITVQSCKPKERKEASVEQTDSVSTQPADVEEQEEQNEEQQPLTSIDFVQYNGAIENDIKKQLETFSPLAQVLSLSNRAINIEDSIHYANDATKEVPAKDTVLFADKKANTYKAIVAYRKLMTKGPSLKDVCPSLMQLTREPTPGDSAGRLLPPAGKSRFFSQSNFFFIGGAPFIEKLRPLDNATFADDKGQPETHFAADVTENANYLLNSIYHFRNLPTEITYGPPLGSYYGWSRDVRGIGSLIHRFKDRIPVFFLTEEGVAPAFLTSITVKLVPEQLGCMSDQPRAEFACSKSLNAKDILGIYIPYSGANPTTFKVTRTDSKLWTADIDGDGLDDIACASGAFIGASGTLAEVLWFVNINGEWKIVDYGMTNDCT